MKKDFLEIPDFTTEEIYALFKLAKDLKAKTKKGIFTYPLKNKVLAMIFHKPSLRTRLSFEVGMHQLGGSALYITDQEIGMGKRESVGDIAKVLSRYVDCIMIRTFAHQNAVDLAREASVPVINGLTDLLHPCQVLSDLFTYYEKRGTIDGITVAYISDGNNVANSWVNAAYRLPFTFRIACPEGYEPNKEIWERAKNSGKGKVEMYRVPLEAAKGADILYSDVWTSMGQEKEREERLQKFKGYQINDELISVAKKDVMVMHCLPAHRGEEITDSAMDGPNSVVFDEAENRMHLQKAIILTLMKGTESSKTKKATTKKVKGKK